MRDESKALLWVLLIVTIMVCIGVNIIAHQSCKIEAIKAGMIGAEVEEACK